LAGESPGALEVLRIGGGHHAVALAAESDHSSRRVFNVAEREAFSEIEWARLIARHAGWSGRIAPVPSEEMPPPTKGDFRQHWVASSDKVRRELKYAEVVPMEEAIKRTVEWEMDLLKARERNPENCEP
jgi:nucleoside-diphosphate-sugar epimerase